MLLILTFAGVWLVTFTAPKLIQMYKEKNVEVRTDTIIRNDTLYLDVIKTDTMPIVSYVTVVERDTVYRVSGDSIEQTPRVIFLKKKRLKTPLTLRDRILWHYSTQHL